MADDSFDLERVLQAATDAAGGDREKALNWFRTQGLAPFNGKTAELLVREGRADDVVRLLNSISSGASG